MTPDSEGILFVLKNLKLPLNLETQLLQIYKNEVQ
jgi:hypothetical protein